MRYAILLLAFAAFAQDAAEALFTAARTGDVAGVKAQLDKGVDVNSKWRYDTTALMMAARRGHVDVVKLLLERGADLNVKDTFYNLTPLAAAVMGRSPETVKLLLEKNAPGREQMLANVAASGTTEMLKAFLAAGKYPDAVLSRALAAAAGANKQEAVELLKAAGAQPVKLPDVQIDAATLQSYAGTYRDESGSEILLSVSDGKLVLTAGPAKLVLAPTAKESFQSVQYDSVSITMQFHAGAPIGLQLKNGTRTIPYKKAQ